MINNLKKNETIFRALENRFQIKSSASLGNVKRTLKRKIKLYRFVIEKTNIEIINCHFKCIFTVRRNNMIHKLMQADTLIIV